MSLMPMIASTIVIVVMFVMSVSLWYLHSLWLCYAHEGLADIFGDINYVLDVNDDLDDFDVYNAHND